MRLRFSLRLFVKAKVEDLHPDFRHISQNFVLSTTYVVQAAVVAETSGNIIQLMKRQVYYRLHSNVQSVEKR